MSFSPISVLIPSIAYFSSSPVRKLTSKEIKEHTRSLANMMLIDRKWATILKQNFNEHFLQLRKFDHLVNKYTIYNKPYETYRGSGNPYLFDALCSGNGLEQGYPQTFNTYTPEIENDIREMITHTPKSLSSWVQLIHPEQESVTCVTPLFAACVNNKIPLEIIELMLEKGANPDLLMSSNGGVIINALRLFKDPQYPEYQERLKKIKTLFKQFKKNLANKQTPGAIQRRNIPIQTG